MFKLNLEPVWLPADAATGIAEAKDWLPGKRIIAVNATDPGTGADVVRRALPRASNHQRLEWTITSVTIKEAVDDWPAPCRPGPVRLRQHLRALPELPLRRQLCPCCSCSAPTPKRWLPAPPPAAGARTPPATAASSNGSTCSSSRPMPADHDEQARVETACAELAAAGQPVIFRKVAARAQISRTILYRRPTCAPSSRNTAPAARTPAP